MGDLSFFAVLFVVGLAFFLLRTRSSPLASGEEFETIVGSGTPVVVEFFTNT